MNSNKYWRLSPRKTSLLFLPVIVAFLVGGSAPIILGGGFNPFTGILWAMFIGVVDYNMLVLEIKGWMYAFRFALLFFSVGVTAIVGDLSVFETDINHQIEENLRGEHESILANFLEERAKLTNELQRYESLRDCQDPTQPKCPGITKGKGPVYKDALSNITRVKVLLIKYKDEPTIEEIKEEAGVLVKLEVLHEYVGKNRAAGFLFWGITFFIMLLETTPLILKNSKIK